MVSAQLVAERRRELEQLDRQVQAAVAGLFTRVPFDDPPEAAGLLRQMLPDVTVPLGEVASTGAAAFYDEARRQAAAGGSYRARTAATVSATRIDIMARWSAAPLFFDDPQPAQSLARATGGTQRLVREADRETIVQASHDDPDSYGWQRISGPNACKFCLMLADRGGVYKRSTVDFASHDNCGCVGAPTWDPNAREVPARAYEASRRTSAMSATQRRDHRARTRGYLNRAYPDAPG